MASLQIIIIETLTLNPFSFFGDHQPGFSKDLASSLDQDLPEKDWYAVPFFIWANYDIETKHQVETSINYLQNMVLEQSGLGLLNQYEKEVSDAQKKYPVLNYFYTKSQDTNETLFSDLKEDDSLLKKYYSHAYQLIFDSAE